MNGHVAWLIAELDKGGRKKKLQTHSGYASNYGLDVAYVSTHELEGVLVLDNKVSHF